MVHVVESEVGTGGAGATGGELVHDREASWAGWSAGSGC
jgi:hypothetical protein